MQKAIDTLNADSAACFDGGLYTFDLTACNAAFATDNCSSSDESFYSGAATNLGACLDPAGTCSPDDAGGWVTAVDTCSMADAGASPACQELFPSYVIPVVIQ
jgi:hypothetical protein